MEQLQFPVKLFAGASLAAAILFSACTNNDTNTGDAASDTLNTMNIDSTGTPMMTDTGSMMRTDSGAMSPSVSDTGAMNKMNGAAKPNAAKKGRKGAVSIMAPAKLSGPVTPNSAGVYANVDYIPSFPGGTKGLQQYFDDNLQYPGLATDQGVEGTVRVGFTIDENGRLMSPMVEGDNEGYGLDEEALRVVRAMPAWNPGKVGGKAVKTKFVLPVRFQLN